MQRRITISNFDDIKNPYYGGGGAYAIHNLAKYLAQKHKVVVVTGKYPGSTGEIIDNVSYKRIGFSGLGPKLAQVFYSLSLPFVVIKDNFDIWLESFTPPFSTGFLPLFTHKPVIGICHMLASADMMRKYKLPFFLIENIGLKLYKHIIVASDFFRGKIKKANKTAAVTAIPNGVDIPENPTSNGNYVLYLGRIEVNQKGLDLLVEAFSLVHKVSSAKLLIAGTGEKTEIAKLKALIKKQALSNTIKLIGKVEGEEKERIYRKAKMVMLPSRFDTYPLVALEAGSYQKPLVIFDIESLNWLPNDFALKAKAFDPEDLAVQIIKLLNNDHLCFTMGTKGRELAQNRSWEKNSQMYEFVINEALTR